MTTTTITHDDLIALRARSAPQQPEAAPDEGVDIPELEAHTLDDSYPVPHSNSSEE